MGRVEGLPLERELLLGLDFDFGADRALRMRGRNRARAGKIKRRCQPYSVGKDPTGRRETSHLTTGSLSVALRATLRLSSYTPLARTNGNAQRRCRPGNAAQAVTCCFVDYCLNACGRKSAPNPPASKAGDCGSDMLPGAVTRMEKPLWSACAVSGRNLKFELLVIKGNTTKRAEREERHPR